KNNISLFLTQELMDKMCNFSASYCSIGIEGIFGEYIVVMDKIDVLIVPTMSIFLLNRGIKCFQRHLESFGNCHSIACFKFSIGISFDDIILLRVTHIDRIPLIRC